MCPPAVPAACPDLKDTPVQAASEGFPQARESIRDGKYLLENKKGGKNGGGMSFLGIFTDFGGVFHKMASTAWLSHVWYRLRFVATAVPSTCPIGTVSADRQ